MASGGGDGRRVGPGFILPDEILSVIPTDPYDQLDLARKITSMAIASCLTNLEMEAGSLLRKLLDKNRCIQELEEKVSCLKTSNQDAELRLRILQEDNTKLLKEKESFALTVKKLSRDLAKLETFKRQLMQSLNDENSLQTETVDIGTYDQSVDSAPKAYPKNGEEPNCYKTHYSSNESNSASVTDDVRQRLSVTPTGTPKTLSSVSPTWYSDAGSPQRTSGTDSPGTQYDGWGGSLSSYYPFSQQSSAASSPPRGCPLPSRTRVDGKEFFRQVRSRLSLEQLCAFLDNVKDLNAQRQSREEMLRKAGEIFGMDNKDLYVSFQGLLNRNMN